MRDERPQGVFFHPYAQLGLSAILVTAAEVLMKAGAVSPPSVSSQSPIGVAALMSGLTWLGILLLVLSFASWLYVLRLMPITQAFALINIVHVLVPASAWLFLNEVPSMARCGGIALVLAGTYLVAAPAARAEEEL